MAVTRYFPAFFQVWLAVPVPSEEGFVWVVVPSFQLNVILT
jgi:hypothetical protein